MGQELWKWLPPDAQQVLLCGFDANLVSHLKNENPHMRFFVAEADAVKREQAARQGCTVAAHPGSLLAQLQASGVQPDAWLMLEGAWSDETLNSSCRRAWFQQLQPGACVVWEVPNSQYWRRLACLLAGNGADGSAVAKDIEEEWRTGGMVDTEVVWVHDKAEQGEFQKFVESLAPLLQHLKMESAQHRQRWQAAFFMIRGRKKNAQPESPLRIHTVLGETMVCSRVRIEEPHAFLTRNPGIVCTQSEKLEDQTLRAGERLVWIWQRRLFAFQDMLELQQKFLRKQVLTIQEWDDDPLHWEEHFRQSRFVELRSAHAIQTSTEALAGYLREFHPEVQVFPNCLASLEPLTFPQTRGVTLFFGALNRKEDWQPILAPLNRLLRKEGQRVRVFVIHDREFYEKLQCEQKQFFPFCSYEKYQKLLQLSDMALLPLLPTRFNRMKSDLKFLECAGAGTAVLASPTVYEHTVQQGITGLLYTNEAEFYGSLQLLLEDGDFRRRIAANAYRWVAENRMLAQHYRQRLLWYNSLFERFEELSAAISKRVPELWLGEK